MSPREELLVLVKEMQRFLVASPKKKLYGTIQQAALLIPPCCAQKPSSLSKNPTEKRQFDKENLQETLTKERRNSAKPSTQQKIAPANGLDKGHSHQQPINRPSFSQKSDLNALRTLLERATPNMALQSIIPNDTMAKQIASSWQHYGEEPHVLLICDEDAGTKTFCHNLLQALHKHGKTIRAVRGIEIETSNHWESFLQQNLSFCLATQGIWTYAKGKTWIRAMPATKAMFLSTTPLLIMDPIATYTPEKKKALWNNLCTLLHLPSQR